MSDNSTPAAADSQRPPSRIWLLFLAIALAVLTVAGILVLRSGADDEPQPWLDVGWAVADGEAAAGSIQVRVSPAISGKNRLEIDIEPVSGSSLATIEEVDIHLLPYRGNAQPIDLSIDLSGSEQRGDEEVDLTGSDAWEVRVSSTGGDTLATVYLLAPDPNLHGDDAVAQLENDPAAVELYQRASDAVAEWHRVTYEQQLSDGSGLAVVSFREINDGDDGSVPGYRYFTPGGLEAYILGTTAWMRYPGEEWQVRTSNAMIPPSEWGGEFTGATGFQLGPLSDSPHGPCRIVTFVVPPADRQSIAWYAWCIDEQTGTLYRDSMTARAHYMVTEFADFNEPLDIAPPEEALAASAASPTAMLDPEKPGA